MKKTLLFFCLMLVCLVLFGQTSIAPSAGDGTAENPYQIANLGNLYWIAADASHWSAHYIQTADIDASETSTWDDGNGGDPEGWMPIGKVTPKFTGVYDGAGFTIDGIYIDRDSLNYIGLFGDLYGASISNVGINNINISGYMYVGGLAGFSENYTIINNCFTTGAVKGNHVVVGGLVGYNINYSEITKSFSTCSVNSSAQNVGGLVGENSNHSSIIDCYSTGSVIGNYTVGGLVGVNTYSSIIDMSFSAGCVNGNYNLGGLVGEIFGDVTISNSFWDTETSEQITSAGGTGKTTAEMQTQSTFTDATWDFTDVWRMNASINDGYPYLQWQTALTEPTISTLYVTDTLIHNALVYYEISDVGNPDSVTHGICWNTSGDPTLADSSNMEGTVDSTGTYSSIMTGLSPNTLYYVRAYATNATGTAYGEVLSFTSLPEAELIAYWNFDDDNANDLTGIHHGTITGSDVTFVSGKVGNAINFGGSGFGNVEIPSFNAPYITVEAWVNSAKYGYYTSMVTKNYYTSGWTAPWIVWELWLNENTPYPATIGSQWHTVSIVPVSMNEWHHMAFTYDGYTVKVYVNGVEKSSAIVDAGPITSTNGNIYIGKPTSANHNFIGMIDEVAIWDNALTPEDLLQHYQNGLNALGYDFSQPVVSTLNVNDTLIHNALVYYEISDVGNPDSVTHGICWNTSGDPTLADSSNIEGTVDSTGTYSSIMTGLSPNTLYYVRAYATNATGTAYGEVLSFTSLPEAELIAYWNFDDDNTNDVTGMHNGTITGSDVTFVNGKVRRAINFGGSGYGNVEIPSFNLPYITVEAWVNSAKYGYYTSMVTKNYHASSWSSPFSVWELWLGENTALPSVFICWWWGLPSPETVQMNTWYHMAFTYDGFTLKLYVNGIEKASQELEELRAFPETGGNIYIGKPATANHSYIGMIDEVAIWDNALTPEDLLQHYQNGLNALGYVISEPIVSTDSVTEITMTSALCDANITSLGGDSLSAYGVCWGVDPLPTITDDKTDEGSKHVSGTFTSLMPDLSPNTAYYVRAYATNSVGTAYGEAICFTTLDLLWKMQLSVNIGICNDNDNYLGVADDATNDFDVLYDEVKPPAGPGSSVSLSFPHLEWSNPLGDNFSIDIRPEIILTDTMQVWDFEVLSTDPGATTITYTFTRVPDVPVILEDKAIDLKRSLCSGDVYSFEAEANIPRLFSISIGDTTAPELALGASCSGPAILCANTNHTLEWTMQDGNGIDSLQIWFSADSGENYTQIASPNTEEYYDWTLPDTTIIKNGILKFTAQDYAGNMTEKVADNVFAIAGDSLLTTVPAGWNLWGIPIEPGNSEINMNLDDDFTAYYVLYKYLDNGYSFANSLCVTTGYWLGTTEETLIDISGIPLTEEESLSLEQGWNLISDPLVVDILADSLLFVKDALRKTRNEAVSAGWINSIYGYSCDSYEYANKLQPWKGYWISVLETDVSMIFPLHQHRAPSLMKTHTTTPLIAFQTTAGDLHHNILAIGTEDNATFGFDPEYDAITPPRSPGPDFLSLYVPRTDLTNMILGNHFAKDIRATISAEQFEEWVIQLETSETSAQVTWTINAIPSELEIGIDIQGLGYFENMRDMETINVLNGQSFKVRIGANVVGLAKNLIPEVYALGDNYPNPFNPTTTIRYALPEAAYVRLTVYDLNGRAVRTLVSTEQSAGYKVAIWDGRNNTGDLLGSGIYLLRIEAGTFIETKKMAFMK